MYPNLPKPAIIAHRGASAYSPENTIAAFESAVSQHADAVELDVKLSADGQVVVIHDQTVDRTTNGTGKVGEQTLQVLKKLDAGSKFDPSFSGEQIPTLAEVFEAIGGKIFINIELTNYAAPWNQLPQIVADIVQAHKMEEQVLFSSFNPIALRRIHKILPNVPIGLLAFPGVTGAWARSWLGSWVPYQALHSQVRDTNKSLIEKLHRRGKKVNAYTVNAPEDMVALYNLGIDGIFTDDPLLAQRALSQFQEEQVK